MNVGKQRLLGNKKWIDSLHPHVQADVRKEDNPDTGVKKYKESLLDLLRLVRNYLPHTNDLGENVKVEF